jgi:hypothetical protein
VTEGIRMGGCWMGGEDWKDLPHARASGAQQMLKQLQE